ncbi:MAG: type IX secretion system protein PorQ [Bacteroidales bacterium]|nr:type IX secretion system protein PorQ [Candidatus Sodaliphilus limicaballi]
MMALAVTVAACATAQDGTTSYNFLKITPSSHAYALGGNNITVIDDDINLVEQNPALLGPEYDHQVGINYMHYLGGSNFMGARYGQGINDHSAWAAGIQYYGYGSFEGYDIAGTHTGSFSANDMTISATYTHDISEYWRGGITAKFIHSKYEDYSAAALGVDLGVNYYNPNHELSFSLVAKNLGGQLKKFAETRDNLPWDIQMGVSKQFSGTPFRVSLTLNNLRRWKLPYYQPQDKNSTSSPLVLKDSFGSNLLRHMVFGVEFLPNDKLYVGIGYNYKTRTDMSSYQRSILSGFSAGAGLKVKAFGIGFALAQPHNGTTTFMFNLNTSIGELMR